MNANKGLVFAVIAGSGAVLTLVGAAMLGIGSNTLVGAVLMVAGIADLIAAFVLRSRLS